MLTPDSTLREISAAAFEAGFSVTLHPMETPTRADRITAKMGPQGHCWRWHGPWRRWEGNGKPYSPPPGWEREFQVPDIDDDGTRYWPGESKYGQIHIIHLFDEPIEFGAVPL